MKELMFELLTYEPFMKWLPVEEKYIREILSGNYHHPKSMLHDLFSGFYHYVQNGDSKDVDWLRLWKDRYHQNKHYTYSTKSGRAYYPLLFKKICFYIIVREKFSDSEFMGLLDLSVNRIRKWRTSPQYRKYAEADSYSVIRSFRSGAKKEYVVSIIKKLYFEAGRQVSQSMILNKLPPFIDVFAGTASVAASMVSDGCPPPIINDLDPIMVSFAWAFAYHQKELRSRVAKLHNELMKQDFDTADWSYTEDAYEDHYGNMASKPYISRAKKKARRYKEFIIRLRSSYLDSKEKIDSCDINALRAIDFNALPKHTINSQVETILEYALAIYYVYSFKPLGKNGNVFHVACADERSYYSYLNRLKVNLKTASRKDRAVKAWSLTKLRLHPASFTLQSTGDFSRHLQGAKFYSQDFRSILQNGPANGIYYLDSEYFLTAGYAAVDFSDDDHKDMLDLLRSAKFKWVVSMQYNPSERNSCTRASDEADRKKQKHIIRDYGTYYRGFYSPFQLDEDQRVYDISTDALKQTDSNLFAVLFDFDTVKKKWPSMKRATAEMLVVNFNCLPMIPLHDTAVVLPFNLFLQCADKGMAYKEIVQLAITWRKDNIASNYAGKAPV